MRVLLLGILCATAGLGFAASPSWQGFGFDGSGFTKGGASGVIQVRDGYLPVPGKSVVREDQLPEATGAISAPAGSSGRREGRPPWRACW